MASISTKHLLASTVVITIKEAQYNNTFNQNLPKCIIGIGTNWIRTSLKKYGKHGLKQEMSIALCLRSQIGPIYLE